MVKNIRQEIIRLGGEIRFGCKLTDFSEAGGRLISVTVSQREEGGFYREETIPAQAVVLAIGHSARDTFRMLSEKAWTSRQRLCGGAAHPASSKADKFLPIWNGGARLTGRGKL